MSKGIVWMDMDRIELDAKHYQRLRMESDDESKEYHTMKHNFAKK